MPFKEEEKKCPCCNSDQIRKVTTFVSDDGSYSQVFSCEALLRMMESFLQHGRILPNH